MKQVRKIKRWIPAMPTQDGDGVKIFRVAGRQFSEDLDPFLLVDELRSDDSKDYIGGFPPHPHRGFETLTYMKDGLVRHRDHMGNEGVIGPGDLQWMTAGRGVIHSEMPEQQDGLFHGFQLWLNLPAAEKMKPAAYRDIRSSDTPKVTSSGGVQVTSIAGKVEIDGQALNGPIQGLSTRPVYLDLDMPADSSIEITVPDDIRLLFYVYDGQVNDLAAPALGVLEDWGSLVGFQAGNSRTRLLVFGGRPLHEPIVQHGPFVMNTHEQINQAVQDYQKGVLA
ncbi:MAG: pirin family protein [Pseudohongiellaceae bacterium]